MASSQTIKDSLIAAVQAKNPSIDTTKGPIYDLMLRPVPDEIAAPSTEIESIQTLYSPLIAESSNNYAAIDTLGRAFRVSKPTGQRAKTVLVFWFTTLPQGEISIPAGTAVSTSDRSIVYTTLSDVQGVNQQTAYSYYNSSTGRYEIYVDAQASQEGQEFEVPAYRLTALLSRIANVSGVYNSVPATGGVSPGGYDAYLDLIQQRFLGRDSSSFASYKQQIKTSYPDCVVQFVPSSDYVVFRRNVRGDGADAVVASPQTTITEESFSAGNLTEFVPMHQPILQVTDVYLNGSRISDYEVIKDIQAETADSAKARDRVRITRTLKPADTVRVRFSYCNYCWSIQNQLFVASTDDFFGMDVLVRLATQKQVQIAMTVQTTSLTSDLQSSISAFVLGQVNSTGFASSLDPRDLVGVIYETYSEVKSITLQLFRPVLNATRNVGSIALTPYEIPVLDASNLQINILA
jgi:hypothetical protein